LVPELVHHARSDDELVRRDVLFALVAIAPDADGVQPVIVAGHSSDDPLTRINAELGLKKLGLSLGEAEARLKQ
jgi:hypothetical protein